MLSCHLANTRFDLAIFLCNELPAGLLSVPGPMGNNWVWGLVRMTVTELTRTHRPMHLTWARTREMLILFHSEPSEGKGLPGGPMVSGMVQSIVEETRNPRVSDCGQKDKKTLQIKRLKKIKWWEGKISVRLFEKGFLEGGEVPNQLFKGCFLLIYIEERGRPSGGGVRGVTNEGCRKLTACRSYASGAAWGWGSGQEEV